MIGGRRGRPLRRVVPVPGLRARAARRHALRGARAGRALRRRRLPLAGGRGARRAAACAPTTAGRSRGTWAYCSGAPYATHFMGQTFEAPARRAGRPARSCCSSRRAASGRCSTTGATRSGCAAAARTRSASSARACPPTSCSRASGCVDTDTHAHPGLRAARKPALRRAHAERLPVRARRARDRRGQGRARGVRVDPAHAQDAAAADHPARSRTPTTSAGSARRSRASPRREALLDGGDRALGRSSAARGSTRGASSRARTSSRSTSSCARS